MPTTPPQTAQLARLVEGSRAQDELLAQGIDELKTRWATIHDEWRERAEAALVGEGDASNPPRPPELPRLIAQMDRLLDRVAAGERALLGDEGAAGDAALRVRAQRLLNESLSYYIASAINPLQQAMLTGDADLADAARRAVAAARSGVGRALHEVALLHAREVHAARAKELGAERFIYLGPSDGRNRPFCADKVGKTFTREEIAALDNGQGLDVMTRCGGWGCRHHWRAMPLAYDALAQLVASRERDEVDGPWVDIEIPDEESAIALLRLGNELHNEFADMVQREQIVLLLLDDNQWSETILVLANEYVKAEYLQPEDVQAFLDFNSKMDGVSSGQNALVRITSRERLLIMIHEVAHGYFWNTQRERFSGIQYRREQEYFAFRAEEAYRKHRGWPLEFSDDFQLRKKVDELYGFKKRKNEGSEE
jgi:hypothetical protein